MPPDGLDALDAKAEQSKRRHRTPPPPKRPKNPIDPETDPQPETQGESVPPVEPERAREREAVHAANKDGRPKRLSAAGPVDPAVVASTVKVAHDHALAYGAVVRKQTERLDLWLAGIRTARAAGAAPGLLRAGLEDAANRAGIPVEEIPAQVWHAAGLALPR